MMLSIIKKADIGLDWRDIRYKCSGGPGGMNEWTKVEDAMELGFPALPYLVDKDVRMTQVGPILRHVARKSAELFEPSLLGVGLRGN